MKSKEIKHKQQRDMFRIESIMLVNTSHPMAKGSTYQERLGQPRLGASKGGWALGALCVPDIPYDGHMLNEKMEQVNRFHIKKRDQKRRTWIWD
jgi:hypothetical protein